jgi:riboflavin kinase/FMN adenylyltransferase
MQTMATKPAMMNIGHRPTFGGLEMTVETHIFNFNEDIYGKLLLVSIECKIREERKFDTVEALQEQLQIDRDLILKKFELEKDNDL